MRGAGVKWQAIRGDVGLRAAKGARVSFPMQPTARFDPLLLAVRRFAVTQAVQRRDPRLTTTPVNDVGLPHQLPVDAFAVTVALDTGRSRRNFPVYRGTPMFRILSDAQVRQYQEEDYVVYVRTCLFVT
jgi:hypothetical protein